MFQGPCRPGELASQLGQAARTLTDALDILEPDGFAERKPHPTDRRVLLVSVTNRGKKARGQSKNPSVTLWKKYSERFRPRSNKVC
jgi:DNA-binding MarR family transcriptional regulator